jgi:thiol-disulfide isomerase/thioredoxin
LLRREGEAVEAAMASGNGAVREVGSKPELDAAVGGARAAAVHFWASWCEASKQMDEVFAHLAVDFPHALFLRVRAACCPPAVIPDSCPVLSR